VRARRALSGSRDRTLGLWDLQTGQLLLTFAGHDRRGFAAAMTPDGRQGLSPSDDGTLRLWDLQTGHLLRTRARRDRRPYPAGGLGGIRR
jgi:WD40 repeat protein